VGMGHIAAQEGITAMISTSHSKECSAVGFEAMGRRLDEVRAAWHGEGIDIRLELGVEIFLTHDTVSELKSGAVWTLAGSKYVLVELPYQPWPVYTERVMFDLQLAGYVPVLAHPERYTAIQADPNVMYALAERGVLSQITAGALLGDHGNQAKHTAEVLAAHGLAQIISSDSHGLTQRKRTPQLLEALKVAEGLVGAEAAHAMVTDNPGRILSNEHLALDPQQVSPQKWSIGRLFRRG